MPASPAWSAPRSRSSRRPRASTARAAPPRVLLAALVSSLVVVANQVVDTWTEGHLLAAWIVLWTVAFAAIALLAAPARRAGRVLSARWDNIVATQRQASADREYWQAALLDPRVMADISRAMASADVAVDLRNYR